MRLPLSRLDAYLKNAGLFKQRSEAKRACDSGFVAIAGTAVKPSHALKVGDVLTLDLPDLYLEAEVLQLPARSVARSRRGDIIRVLRSERRRRQDVLSFDDD